MPKWYKAELIKRLQILKQCHSHLAEHIDKEIAALSK